MPVAQPPILSVVIGAQDAYWTILECLATVTAQADAIGAEVIVADGSRDGTAEVVASRFPGVTLIRGTTDHLVPHLWAQGIGRARAPLVAITTAHCIPAEDWLDTLLRVAAEHEGAAGIGGVILPPAAGTAKDWAVYFSRYSAYMPPGRPGPAQEIAGDNAAYRRDTLVRCQDEMADGFWETIVHRRLRADGERLYLAPAVRVRQGRLRGAWRYAGVRFRHGRHYGSTRPAASAVVRLGRALAGPALLPLLLLRTARRVIPQHPDWTGRYVRALPWLCLFFGAWSLGEMTGYLVPASGRR